MFPIQWKGRTFNQIYSFLQKNTSSSSNMFSSNPLKHYRREIASTERTTHAFRQSTKMDVLNRPNGTINNSKCSNLLSDCPYTGLANIIDIKMPENTCNKLKSCDHIMLSTAENAKRRVRSSGMNRPKYDIVTNHQKYYTTTNQYLTGRNISYHQNQYNYMRKGDSTSVPGTVASIPNIYSPQGTTICKPIRVSRNTDFSYTWIDDNTLHEVPISSGYYNMDDINTILKQQMFKNNHYYIVGSSNDISYYYHENIVFLLKISYNPVEDKVELRTIKADADISLANNYKIPTVNSDNGLVDAFVDPNSSSSTYPKFKFKLNDAFADLIGFVGDVSYPSDGVSYAQSDAYKIIQSVNPTTISTQYSKTYYKPNNHKFAQQGAVSAGDLLTRKRYNAIMGASGSYRTIDGVTKSNALAYGIPPNGYTIKEKYGYPIRQTPTFTKYSDEMKICDVTSFRL